MIRKTLNFLVVYLLCMPVCALAIDPKDIESPSNIDVTRYNNYQLSSREITDTPFIDDPLSYSVTLPKQWVSGAKENLQFTRIPEGVVGDVARYYSQPVDRKRAYFELSTIKIDRNIRARDWLIDYILKSGYALQTIKVSPGADHIAEASYTRTSGDETYSVYSRAIITGSRMALASTNVPIEVDSYFKEIQRYSVESFELGNVQKTEIEEVESLSFLDVARFKVPANWYIYKPRISSADAMYAHLQDVDVHGSLRGKIEFFIYKVDDPASLKNNIIVVRGQLAEDGFNIGKLIESAVVTIPEKALKYRTVEVYEANYKDNTQKNEIWLGFLYDGKYNMIVTLWTPARDTDFLAWAENTKTFELILQSLKL